MSIFGQIFSFFRRKSQPSAIEEELEERRLHPRVNPKEDTRILVIDDSPTILTAMKRFIESAHCVFLGAIDAKMGMEVALTQKPDMIFLDIVMPGINGFAALRALRKNARTRDIPIIMMSGNEQAKAQFFGAHIGADDFMKKPFSRFEVFAHVARLLDEDRVPRRPPLDLPYNAQAEPVELESPVALESTSAPALAESPERSEAAGKAPPKKAAGKPVPPAKAVENPDPAGETTAAAQKEAPPKPAKAPKKASTKKVEIKPTASKATPKAPAGPAVQSPPQSVAPASALAPAPDHVDTVGMEHNQAPTLSAQVVSITSSAFATAPSISPELLSRIARLAQLAQSDPEALKTLVVLASQLCAQFAAEAGQTQPPPGIAPRSRAAATAN
ncbi:MAG: response regulator [Azoarcus sp.]|nr:response regulator [Azoarcus sp.]